MNFNNEKEGLVDVLALLMNELNISHEQDKRVTVHIETEFLKIHEDFLPGDIQVDIDNGQISIDCCEDFGDRSWFFDLNKIFITLINTEYKILKFKMQQGGTVVFQF